MGQVAGLATVVMIASQLIMEMILLSTGTNVGGGYVPTTGVLMCVFAGNGQPASGIRYIEGHHVSMRGL